MSSSNEKLAATAVYSNQESSDNALGTVTSTKEGDIKLLDILPKHGKPWYKVPSLVNLNLIVFSLNLASTTTGYDGSLINTLQSMPLWVEALGSPTSAILGTISNGVSFGMLAGLPLAGYLADKIGRRYTMYIGNIILIVGTVLQACSGLWISDADLALSKKTGSVVAVFVLSRVIMGVGNLTVMASATPLQSELCYPTHRQPASSVFNACWYLGALLCAWVGYGTRNLTSSWAWRTPVLLQATFPLLMLITIYYTPESPRYLVSKGRAEEARAILVKYHAAGDENSKIVDFEMKEIQEALEQDKIANETSYLDFFKTKGNRKRLFLVLAVSLISQLAGNSLVSYYLSKILVSIGISSTVEQLRFNGILMTYNFVTAIFTNLYVQHRFSRRQVFLSSLTFMLLIFIVWSALSAINYNTNFENKSLGKGVMAMIFLFYFCFNYGLAGPMYLYISEILPFGLRAKGTAVANVAANVAGLFNGYVNPIALDAIVWKFYAIYCAALFVELNIVYFTYVETSGRSLEEVAEIFDNDDIKFFVHTEYWPFAKKGYNSNLKFDVEA